MTHPTQSGTDVHEIAVTWIKAENGGNGAKPAEPPTPPHPLGRRKARDPRDAPYAMKLPKRLPAGAPTERLWSCKTVLNQGDVPACVGYSWAGFLFAAPLMGCPLPALDIYAGAQANDEWPGSDYDGSSVRGGAKFLHKRGIISGYEWATGVDQVKMHVLTRGPVVVGTSWYEDMFYPERNGGYLIPKGGDYGGHAWLIVGYDLSRDAFRKVGSWGRTWGENGRAWIRRADLGSLIDDDGGEACSAMQADLRKVRP